MNVPKPSKDWCCVQQCKSDGRKCGRYAYMSDFEFFFYITWTERIPKLRKKSSVTCDLLLIFLCHLFT